jgi:hypothetical protein
LHLATESIGMHLFDYHVYRCSSKVLLDMTLDRVKLLLRYGADPGRGNVNGEMF